MLFCSPSFCLETLFRKFDTNLVAYCRRGNTNDECSPTTHTLYVSASTFNLSTVKILLTPPETRTQNSLLCLINKDKWN